MSDIGSAIDKVNSVLSIGDSIGIDAARAALHQAFPNDHEYYMMALELVSHDDHTIDYFVFPVNPSTYTQMEPSATNVQKTMAGVSVTGNSSFIPINISIQGNFGRKFKILVGKDSSTKDLAVAHFSTTTGMFDRAGFDPNLRGKFRKTIMNSRVKTGYGALKILESICNKSQGDIDGKPNQLYMYNPAFNSNYLVKVINFKITQNQSSSNMIWGYDIQLTAVAPLEVIVGASALRKSLSGSMTRAVVQNSANKVLDAVRRLR